MIPAAGVLLLLGSLLHSWYGGNSRVKTPSDVAMGFIMYGKYVLAVGIVFLVVGLTVLWIAKGILWAILGALAYFYVLPVVTLPLLVTFKLLPRYTLPWLDKGR